MKPWWQRLWEKFRFKHSRFKIGDVVRVKAGVADVDLGGSLTGWQGRIMALPSDKKVVGVAWDSLTLRSMPAEMITVCIQRELKWWVYYLGEDDIELAEPRDTLEDVKVTLAEIKQLHISDWLIDADEIWREALTGVDEDDLEALLEAWATYLRGHLTFPFEARVVEVLAADSLKIGERVKVLGISHVDDFFGIIVEVRGKNQRFFYRLCDLRMRDQKSKNYQILESYFQWWDER